MRHISLIGAALLFVATHAAFACDCDYGGEFLKVARASEFVALVKMTRYLRFDSTFRRPMPLSMEVEVIDVYKGKETRKTVTVWGNNGMLCRPYLSNFDTGKHYFIAFDKADDGSKGYVHKNERPTDYTISVCGEYWLTADIGKQTAAGEAIGKNTVTSEIKLADIEASLTK
ncbi:MAG: hypothetical protein H7330_07130 [Hymenobacteraceae bacterium]|nr:hypothetical protein [Hymenobacteraceae bacterium]